MDHRHYKLAEELANREYAVGVFSEETRDGKTLWVATNAELLGCLAQGESQEEALRNLREARVDYIASLVEDGLPVPHPSIPLTVTAQTDVPQTRVRGVRFTFFREGSGPSSEPERVPSGELQVA